MKSRVLNFAILKGPFGNISNIGNIDNIGKAECPASDDYPVAEPTSGLNWILWLSLTLSLLFALFHYLQAGYDLFGIAHAGIASSLLVSALVLNRKQRTAEKAVSLFLVFTLLVTAELTLLGGVEGSGIVWSYAFPFLACWLKGHRQGVKWTLAWALLTAVTLASAASFPMGFHYPAGFIWQASMAILLYGVVALWLSRKKQATTSLNKASVPDAGTNAYLEKLEQIAYLDGVTGLPNRLRLKAILAQEINVAQERGQALLIVHIRLKKMFETSKLIGSEASDKLLIHIAATMTAAVGSRGIFARVRRDEFVCVYRQHTQEGNASEIIREVLAFKLEYKLNDFAIHIDHTTGVANYPLHGQDTDILLHKAEQAMLQAQFAGQSLAFYDEKLEQERFRHHLLFGKLQEALQKNGLSLHYQAQMDLHSAEVVAAEALLRWIDPMSGPINPAEFIPIAEKTGLIKPLTRWVLREALSQLARWRTEGLDLSVAINLPVSCFMDGDLLTDLRSLLREFDVPASFVILELSESSLTDMPEAIVQAIAGLRKMGFRLSLNDFGNGHLSMSSLKNLKIDEIKIDHAFMRNMALDANSSAIVQSAIQLAHNLNLTIVAVGIENYNTERQLHEMGCDHGQGYHFCKPMPADVFSQWAKAWQINRRAAMSA